MSKRKFNSYIIAAAGAAFISGFGAGAAAEQRMQEELTGARLIIQAKKGVNMENLYMIFKITVNAAGIITMLITSFVMIAYAIGAGNAHDIRRRIIIGIAGFLLLMFAFFAVIWC